jgi:hypothetical protein
MKELLDRIESLESYRATAERRLALWRGAAVLVSCAALLMFSLRSVTAQAGGSQAGGLPALTQRVTVLVGTVSTHGSQITALQNTVATQSNQIAALQNSTSGQSNQIAALQAALNQETADRKAGDTQLQNTATGLESQITPLTDLFLATNGVNGQPFFSRQGNDIYITGANLHIINGLGATNGNPSDPFAWDNNTVGNGLGNLIVGYNELGTPRGEGDFRTGSHNIVVGSFDSYSGFGGIVAGSENESTAAFATVTGGISNTASAIFSVVSGGERNTASAEGASVSGGQNSEASGKGATVSGGKFNSAKGPNASVSGGLDNFASDFAATVSGGNFNDATAERSTISGGTNVILSDAFGWAAGRADDSHVAPFHSP